MVLESSLTITEKKMEKEGQVISTLEVKAKTVNDEESIKLQPDALADVMIPPDPKPPSFGMPLHIPYERPVTIPKWIKIDRRTKLPPVLKRVMGSQQINAWMRDIAHELIKSSIENNRFHYRKFRREFRHRVTVEKRERKKQRTIKEHPELIPVLYPELVDSHPVESAKSLTNEKPLSLEASHTRRNK